MKKLLLILCLAAPVFAQGDTGQDRDHPRVHFTTPLAEVQVVADGGGAERALFEYEKLGGDPVTPDAMARIYAAAGKGDEAFKNVAYLIANGKISERDSIAMAEIREAMIEKLFVEIGAEKGWRIARSDSGNTASGMKSDLDQTLFVFEGKHTEAGWVFERNEELDSAFIEEFQRRWAAEHGPRGLPLEAVDVVSIEGRNKFPDVRLAEVEAFWAEQVRTAEGLRNTPGAYTYPGATGHQMQFRALEAVLARNRRAYQVYGPSDSAAGASWTRDVGTVDEAIKVMFGRKPELRPVWSFDAALANFLCLQHYMYAEKFDSKYHLRTWEDSAFAQFLADQGLGHASKVELVDMGLNQRRRLNEVILARIVPGDGADAVKRRRLHEMALEISVALRQQHKGTPKKVAAFRGRPPEDSLTQRRLIFSELGGELYGDAWGKPEYLDAQLRGVARRYRELASEFCLETAYHSSKQAFAAPLDADGSKHLDFDRYRRLMDVESDADWIRTRENLRDAAHLTFLYGIYDLGLVKSVELLDRIRTDFGNQHLPQLLGLWLRGRIQGIEGPLREQGFRRLFVGFLETKLPEIGDRVNSHILSEIGYERVPIIDEVNAELMKYKLVWDARTLAKNMIYDPGNLDAMAQIVRVYVESKGDPEDVSRAIADEFLMAVPVLGQVVGASRANVLGLVAMGAAMAYPPLGGVLIVISVGQAGYAIYDVEVARPAAANAVNAVYRGFIGPETREFGVTPPPFTAEDEADLQSMRLRLETERPKDPITKVYSVDAARAALEAYKARWEPYRKLQAELEPRIGALRQKKKAWEAYRDDPAYGGYFSEASAQTAQRPFVNYLLESIEPIISYSPAGIVDFRAEQDSSELQCSQDALASASNFAAEMEARARYQEASLQRVRRERAEVYVRRATGRSREDAGLHEGERSMGLPELRYKLKRDSLYPALIEMGWKAPDAFVDEWFRANDAVLLELLRTGLVQPDTGLIYEPGYPRPRPRYTRLSGFPEAYMKQLKEIVRADFERSKILWERYREREDARLLKAKQDLERRMQSVEAAAAGLAVGQLLDQPGTEKLRQLYDAMNEGVGASPAPDIRCVVYRRPESNKAAGDRPLGDHGYAVDFRVRADPMLYRPDYSAELRAFDPVAAAAAITASRAGDLPLLPTTVATLRRALELGRPVPGEKDERVIFLVSVFCGSVHDSVVGVPAVGDRCLIGQSIHTDEPKKEEVNRGRLWTFGIDYQLNSDFDQHTALIRQHFPQIPKVDAAAQGQRAKSTASADITPSLGYIDLDKIAKILKVNEAFGKQPGHGLDMAGSRYRGSVYIRATCGGETRHMYYLATDVTTGNRIGHGWISGLGSGTHAIKIDAVTGDGQRVAGTIHLVVELPPSQSLDRSRERVAIVRKRLRDYPDPRNSLDLSRALRGQAKDMAAHSASSTESIVAVIDEAVARLGDARIPDRRGVQVLPPEAELKEVEAIASLCRTVGSKGAYEALRKALAAVEPRLDMKVHASKVAYLEHSLGTLVIGATGDLGTGRRHIDRSVALKSVGAKGTVADVNSWWPRAGDFVIEDER